MRVQATRTPAIVAPTILGRRSRATVSTSGSSGIDSYRATGSAGASPRGTGVIASQSSPTLTSTVSGTSRGIALSIVRPQDGHEALDLVPRHLEQQLVVDLEQRPGVQALVPQPIGQPDHRDLDDVRGRALDRHVDGHPLARRAEGRVAGRQLGDVAAPPDERRDEALGPGLLLDREHVVADARVGREVRVDEVLGLLAADVGARGQAEVAHPVGDPEVDHLGHRALVGGDVGRLLVEHPRGRVAVDVGVARERLLEVLVAGHVGEDAQLDLRVVGRHEHDVRAAGDERPPDPPAELGSDRDVLEVRVGRREAPGRGHRLVERRVQPPVGGDECRQGVDVGRAQLRVRPPFEELVDHRVRRAELLEHRRVGRVAGLRLLALRQVELGEEHLLELLGAAEVELVADVDVDLGLEPGDLGPELRGQRRQPVAVDRDAGRLHPGEDGDQRQLDLGEQAIELLGGQAALERRPGGDDRERIEPGPRGRVQAGRVGQDQVELLGDDVGDASGCAGWR